MPNFHLSADESDRISAFLLSFEGAKVDPAPPGNAEQGKTLVESARAALIAIPSKKDRSALRAPSLDELRGKRWTGGCLATDAAARKNAPDFGLSPAQCDAVNAFAATDRASLGQDAAAEFATRQMHFLRCTACHARDGAESLLGTTYDAEATRPAESVSSIGCSQ